MSTKTSIKRIAAVAAVALTLGGFSAVSAHAASSLLTAAAVSGNPTTGSVGSAVTLQYTETSTAGAAADTAAFTSSLAVTSDGNHSRTANTALATNVVGAVTNGTVAVVSNVATYTATAAGTVSATVAITFTPDVPGTYTVSVTPAGGAAVTQTVTVAKTSPQFLNSNNFPAAVGVSATTGSALTAISGGFATAQILVNSISNDLYITYSGVGSITAASSTVVGALTNSNGSALSAGLTSALKWTGSTASNATTDVISLSALSTVAGTGTITIQPVNASTGVPGTAVTGTITWGAAPVVSAQYSTAYIATGSANGSANALASALVFSKSATGVVANVAVTLNSAAATPISAQGLSVSIAGAGTLSLANSTTASATAGGRSLSTAAASGNSSSWTVGIFSDGTTGTGTITISSGTTAIATKTVTFVGGPSKATVTQGLYVAKAGSRLGAIPDATDTLNLGKTVATTAAFIASVVDANGNPVAAGSTVKMVSSDSIVITAGSCAEWVDAAGSFECSVNGASGALSGQTATVTFEVYNPTTAAYDILATPLTFAIGGAIASEAMTTDAASYSALAPIVISVAGLDSKGNKAYDQDTTLLSTLVSSTQLGGTLASPAALVNSVGKIKGIYAPTVAGNFTVSAVDAASGLLEAVSVTAASNGTSADAAAQAAVDAANEATDAANAATDAANNAMDSADAAQQAALDAGDKADAALAAVTDLASKVADIATQIAALSSLVSKIAASVAKISAKVKA